MLHCTTMTSIFILMLINITFKQNSKMRNAAQCVSIKYLSLPKCECRDLNFFMECFNL